MRFAANGYAVALWAAALVSLFTAVASWNRRNGSWGNWSFAAMMTGVVLWSLMDGMEAAAETISSKILFSKIMYVGVCAVAPLFLKFAWAYGGWEKQPRLFPRLFVWAVPAITVGLVLSNERHHLVWTGFAPARFDGVSVLLYGHGPWYWVWVAYCGAVTLLSVVMLVQSTFQWRSIYVGQTLVFVAGAAMPWIGEALSLSPVNPFPGLDLPSIGFAFTGALLLLGMSKFSLFDIVPFARNVLVERMSDGVVVLDRKDRVVDVNPAAQAILKLPRSVIGRMADDVFASFRFHLSPVDAVTGEDQAEVSRSGEPPWHLDLRIIPLRNRRGTPTGRMVVLRDITLRRLYWEERERLNEELRATRDDLKTLSGLLPICSSCKKIRDDSGVWQNLEQYIQSHSEAHFSHGICNECMEKLYPGLNLEDSL
jgi:hypothetical protein